VSEVKRRLASSSAITLPVWVALTQSRAATYRRSSGSSPNTGKALAPRTASEKARAMMLVTSSEAPTPEANSTAWRGGRPTAVRSAGKLQVALDLAGGPIVSSLPADIVGAMIIADRRSAFERNGF
jgi:hypothetical protein